MATRENHGSQGRMYLKRDREESSSGHVEEFDDISLEASPDEKGVVLVRAEGTKHFIRSADSTYRETKTYISVQDLVRLIEKHGSRS